MVPPMMRIASKLFMWAQLLVLWNFVAHAHLYLTYEYAPNDWWLCPKKEHGNQTNLFYYFMGKAQNQFEVSLGCKFQDKIMDRAWNTWRPHITHYLI